MKKTVLFLLHLTLAFLPMFLFATNYTWNGATGNWNTASNWTPNGVPGAGDNVNTSNAGSIALTNDVTVNNFTSSGATVTGNFNITISGTLSFSGIFDGVGTITVAGATTFPGGLPSLFGGRILVLNGGGTINPGREIRLSGGSQIVIPVGQTLTKTTSGDETWATGNGGTLVIDGTFVKAGTGRLSMELYKVNCTGTINVNEGNLFHTLNGGTNTFNGADITIASGFFYGPNGGTTTFTDCNISGGGSFGSTGNRTIASGNVITSNMYMSGGTHTINQDISPASYNISNGTLNGTGNISPSGDLIVSNGTVSNTGNWTVGGNLNWSGGTFSGAGTVIVQSITNITGTATKTVTGGKSLILDGGADWLDSGGISIGSGSLIRNPVGQTFTRNSTAGAVTGAGTFDNHGTFEKATTGTISLSSVFLNSGTVKGIGTISWGTLTNTGFVAPGLSPGFLTMDKFNNSSATLSIELAGPGGAGAANGHDQLIVTTAPTITLGGTVEVDFLNGFNPSSGSFIILTYTGTASGALPTLTCISADCIASNMQLVHNATDKTLSLVVNSAPICSMIADAGSHQTICLGSSATLMADATGGTAPYSYQWSNGETTQSIWVNPSSSASFGVTITDDNGCEDDDTAIVTVETTDNDEDGYAYCNDCDDNNPTVHPNATEICNGLDDDCDSLTDDADPNISGQSTFYADNDGDGYGAGSPILACMQPANTVNNNTDCDDNNASIHPNATEACNDLDDDCDGEVDEGLQTTFYADSDGDGYGNVNSGTFTGCTAPPGYVSTDTDCNDANPDIYPGALEVCNLLDDDCDGLIDDGLPTYNYYLDADGDGYGNPDIYITTCFGVPDEGYVTPYGNGPYDGDGGGGNGGGGNGGGGNGGGGGGGGGGEFFDTDDDNPEVNPGMPEICNGIDDDSDNLTDEDVLSTFYTDADNDGYGDPDGPTTQACTVPEGFSANNTDCDDTNPAINPATPEVCNGLDDNCDGLADNTLVFVVFYTDIDGDGDGDPTLYVSTCDGPPVGYVLNSDDCDDSNPNVYPGAPEICDGLDNDCDGLIDDADPDISGQSIWFVDADNDGFGNSAVSQSACNQPIGYVANDDDCNDGNAAINPMATEICDGLDNDCDGMTDDDDLGITGQPTWYADADGDTYGDIAVSQLACNQPAGYVANADDCDDTNFDINPAATEVCNDLDDDCDGLTDDDDPSIEGQITWFEDGDGDGYGNASISQISCDQPDGFVANNNDCNDSNMAVNPNAIEICNGIDDDCDGLTDEVGCGTQLTVEAGECQVVYYGYEPFACTTLNAVPSGGTAPYTYAWSNGQSGSSIQVCPTTSQTYTVTVTDNSGDTAIDGVTVEVVDVHCGQNNNKVLLCHNGSTHCVSANAVADHLGHGDELGTCGTEPCFSGDGPSPMKHTSTINSTMPNAQILCYPNPASQEINVLFEGWALENGVVEIADFSGKTVQQIKIQANPGEPTRLDLSGFAPGLYLIRCSSSNELLATKTFVVAQK